jgi:signal transduction histidine kinase
VRAHGGEIQCWNNEGVFGSTFMVRIPLADTESAAATVSAKEAGR